MKLDELLVAIQDAANTVAAPNWADKLSVVLSLLAIIAAGIVAWRQNMISRKQSDIADRQNKIALFEKRLEIYNILSSCRSSADNVKWVDENEDFLEYLFNLFVENPGTHQEFNCSKARLYLTNCSTKLDLAYFFFSEEINFYIIFVSARLLILANADPKVDGFERYNEIKQKYIEAVKELEKNKIFERIEAEMKMV